MTFPRNALRAVVGASVSALSSFRNRRESADRFNEPPLLAHGCLRCLDLVELHFEIRLAVRSCVRTVALALFSCWYSATALLRWRAASIFFVNLSISNRPARSGPVVISAFFSAYLVRYHGCLSRCGGSSLSPRVAYLASRLASSFPLMPEWLGTRYNVTLIIRSFFTIPATTSWLALALQPCIYTNANCEKRRILDAGTGNPARSMAMHDGLHGQLAVLLIAGSSVKCASAWSELATVFEMDTIDGVAYTPTPARPLRTDASTKMSTCPGL